MKILINKSPNSWHQNRESKLLDLQVGRVPSRSEVHADLGQLCRSESGKLPSLIVAAGHMRSA